MTGRRIALFVFVAFAGAVAGYFTQKERAPETYSPFIDPVVLSALEPFRPEEADARKHRVMIIGWDGADFRFIDPLMGAGKMPHLEALAARGVSDVLESTIIPISSAAWTSSVTGKSPAKTGVFSFFETVPGTYNIRVISSRNRRATPVWRILNRHDRNVIVFGMPVTYPPERVKSIMVSGMLSPEEADYAYPPGLAGALRSVGFLPDLGIWREDRALNYNILYNQLETKRHALNALLTGNDWDAAIIVFKSLDVLKHRGTTGESRARVDDLYRYLDRMLGSLERLAGERCDIIVLSDHGFRSYGAAFNINGWLVERGFAKASEDSPNEKIDRSGPIATARTRSHAYEMSLLDLPRSAAFTGPAEGNFGSIRINLAGREPDGAVTPDRYDAVVDAILDSLRSAADPVYGGPLVRRAFRTGDLYDGEFLADLPDILFEADERLLVRPFTRYPSVDSLDAPLSDHELAGILVAAGPSFRHIEERGSASILDITPTLLALFDLPIHRDMDGEPLTSLLDHPAKVCFTEEPPDSGKTGGEDALTGKERKELEKRLKSMSYTR